MVIGSLDYIQEKSLRLIDVEAIVLFVHIFC